MPSKRSGKSGGDSIRPKTAIHRLRLKRAKPLHRFCLSLSPLVFGALLFFPVFVLYPLDVVAESPTIKRKPPSSSAYKHYLRAKAYQQKHRYAKAVDELRLALAYDTDSAWLHFELGRSLIASSRPKLAAAQLKKAIHLKPAWAEPHYLLGEIAFYEGRLKKAKAHLRRSLAIDSTHEIAMKRYGEILYLLHGLDAMLAYFEEVLDNDPLNALALNVLTRAYLQKQEYQKLEESLKRLIRIEPDNLEAIEKLAGWYSKTGRYKMAIDLFKRLQEALPNHRLLLMTLGKFCLKADKIDEAKDYFAQAKALITNDADLLSVGFAYFETEKYQMAAKEFEAVSKATKRADAAYFHGYALLKASLCKKAIKAFQALDNRQDHYGLMAAIDRAQCDFILGRKQKADERVEESVRLNHRAARVYRLAAHYYLDTERPLYAVQVLNKGLQVLGDEVSLLYLLATTYTESGQETKALDTIRALLEIDPNHADALNYLGFVYADKGIRLKDAERMIRKALTLNPEQGYIIDSLGWVLFKQGRLIEAKKWLMLAAMMEPNEMEILFHLAVLLKAINPNDPQILKILKQAAGLKPQSEQLFKKFQRHFPALWPRE